MTQPDQPALAPEPDAGLFDDEWQQPKRTDRLTVLLVVALLVVGGFAGGVLVQKHHDSRLLAGPAAPARRSGAGSGGQQGGRASAVPDAGATTDASGELPVVVGTVRTVDTDAIEVTDRSGAVVRVFVPRTATVTTTGLGGLTFDTPVSVAGTKAVDGSVTATSVTVRRPGA